LNLLEFCYFEQKFSPVSHLKERKEKICLNCRTEVVGRYCHNCGQENLEPKETVWHLVEHFFNDITHFDGKFFSTVKYLMRKPGFLSKEYMAGRRMSYLNPIRTYVFTSAIFFIILFSLKKPEDMIHSEKKEKAQTVFQLKERQAKLSGEIAEEKDDDDREDLVMALKHNKMELAMIRRIYGDSTKKAFSKTELGELLMTAYNDSLVKSGVSPADRDRITKVLKTINNPTSGSSFFGLHQGDYKNVEEYDSVERALPDSMRDGWLKRASMHRLITLDEQYQDDPRRFKEHLMENIFHSFPKILFVSLPIFAMLLNIMYFRHKQYLYVDHGIFTIHVYCATFILLLVYMLLSRLETAFSWTWLHVVVDILIFGITVYLLIYLYKAMRGFYGQGRKKTFVKYFLVGFMASVINTILLLIFLFISVISI
jgi:uncharacterized protein DUF3667